MGKICLIAGHGQGDPGASGGGYNEATTMRQLVNKIKALIPNEVDVYDTSKDAYKQNALASTNYKNVIEFHMDGAGNMAACGGHVIIASGFNPDSLDIALKNVISKHIGIWVGRPDGFSKRNDLQNLNVAAKRGIAYRLLELGFITNSNDRSKTIGNMDTLAKLLAEAISGKTVTTPTPPSSGNSVNGADVPVKTDAERSTAHLDEFQVNGNNLYTRGWHIGNYKYQYLIIIDANTNKEVARRLAKGVSRPDVNEAHKTSGNVGFSENFDLAQFKGRTVYLLARCTNDSKGNGAGGFSDIDFKQWPISVPK